MFNFSRTPKTADEKLDERIDDLLDDLGALNSTTEEYSNTADQTIKLMKLKKELNPSWRPSPDALIGAAASVLGIILVLNYEKFDVVTSKAFGFIGKMK